ncbi:tyrosine-protein phosphatase [Kistimonas scapharcae]|uniref:protein-tyrosine-phosphatase n=1 Tax=Kistimonas scapharcae TaxID=1036133 RepID=A0ABP8V9A3_9GAMM
MIDIHNHIIPGIDDGAAVMADALALLNLAVDDGITHVVCTPHMHAGRYDNDIDTIRPAFDALQQAAVEASLPVSLAMAAEVRISDEFMVQLRRGKVPMLGQWEGSDCVLLEMPHQNLPMGMDNLLAWLQRQNVRAVIAHPERNKELMRHPERSLKLVERGVLFQVTAGSVAGHFGRQAQETARWLLDRELVQFVASDAHHAVRRPPAMGAAATVLDDWYGVETRQLLTEHLPRQLTATLFGEGA